MIPGSNPGAPKDLTFVMPGFEPREGSGNLWFLVAETLKPQGFKAQPFWRAVRFPALRKTKRARHVRALKTISEHMPVVAAPLAEKLGPWRAANQVSAPRVAYPPSFPRTDDLPTYAD